MKITFLGTGGSQGIPVVACECDTCKSIDVKDKKLRSSILVEVNDLIFTIDSGPDFRQQLLRENVKRLDAIIFTHGHKDHVAGLDDIRSFNYLSNKPMDLYLEPIVLESIQREFTYIFASLKYLGIPRVNINTIYNQEFNIGDLKIIPIRVMHYMLPILGFRIADFTYLTDVSYITDEEIKKVIGTKVLVVNALRIKEHISHFNLEQALSFIDKVKPETAYITHVSHLMGKYSEVKAKLPPNVFLAYDRLVIEM